MSIRPNRVKQKLAAGEVALVHLRAADIPHLEQALERLRSESFIISTKSMIVLSRLVDAATQTTGPSPAGAGSSGTSSTGAGPAGAIGDGQPGSIAPPAEP